MDFASHGRKQVPSMSVRAVHDMSSADNPSRSCYNVGVLGITLDVNRNARYGCMRFNIKSLLVAIQKTLEDSCYESIRPANASRVRVASICPLDFPVLCETSDTLYQYHADYKDDLPFPTLLC